MHMARKDVLPGGPLHLAAPSGKAEYAVDAVKLSCQHSELRFLFLSHTVVMLFATD